MNSRNYRSEKKIQNKFFSDFKPKNFDEKQNERNEDQNSNKMITNISLESFLWFT